MCSYGLSGRRGDPVEEGASMWSQPVEDPPGRDGFSVGMRRLRPAGDGAEEAGGEEFPRLRKEFLSGGRCPVFVTRFVHISMDFTGEDEERRKRGQRFSENYMNL